MILFKKLDIDNDQKLSLKEIYGLRKHLLIANNFNCELLFKYSFLVAVDRVIIDEGEDENITHISFE